ncbi:hypothetical protein DSO57_1000225 [Entomophthora muscae]|uniref:Uncharacterized protein n=1 Tax=Entomophthora muscae TaxID=34485 RepID=A0ACC2U7X9_9FUNG|nr:hypothetical protein DSO57_1000225 [Entomophthora muscae]
MNLATSRYFYSLFKTNRLFIEKKFHPKTILYRLREEQTIIDSESCELTAQFLRKDLSIEEYIKKYRDSRTRFHQYELRIGSVEKRALPVLDSVGTSIKFFGN